MVKFNPKTMRERREGGKADGKLIGYVDISVFPLKTYTVDEVER
jgi:hypothetical protein